MAEIRDDEAFRLEFVARMSAILGIKETPVPPSSTARVTAHASQSGLLEAVQATSDEIARLRHRFEAYAILSNQLSKCGAGEYGTSSAPSRGDDKTKRPHSE